MHPRPLCSQLSRLFLLGTALLCGSGTPIHAQTSSAPVSETEANIPVECEVTAERAPEDPFNGITLDVSFTDPAGHTLRVPAFWAGGNKWKVRYASSLPGEHRFRTAPESITGGDAVLQAFSGTIKVVPGTSRNPLYQKGGIRVASDRRHFAYADGTPFFWLGDTWWMGLTSRLTWPADFQTLTADRRGKGFTVVQIVAGLYPDMPAFDERGANEAGFPWEKDYSRIRPEYFDAADRRIRYLADEGLVPCIVGAWGYHLPWLGVEKMKQHWRYLIARWGALPVVWCAAGETTMPFYLSKTRQEDARRQQQEWTAVMRYIRGIDPWHRMVTCHPSETARASVTDPSVLDFDMHQSGHGAPAARHAALAWSGWNTQPVMPVISGESRYEALEIRPTLTAADARKAFWSHVINSGCAGHTYGANGVWQVNGVDKPYGNSPGGNNWGTTPWSAAMRLPGSAQLGAARKLIESLPGWNELAPHPEWVSAAAPSVSAPALDEASWIWYPEGEPAKNAPQGARYFQKVFTLPGSGAPATAALTVSADDFCEVWLNGKRIGESADWKQPLTATSLTGVLRTGENILSIRTENRSPEIQPNPAGLIAAMEITPAGGAPTRIPTDASWICARESREGWPGRVTTDAAWVNAAVAGLFGIAPWGRPAAQNRTPAPLCAGIDNRLRLVYLEVRQPVLLRGLTPGGAYALSWFDATAVSRTPEQTVTASEKGTLESQPLPGGDDWVLTARRLP